MRGESFSSRYKAATLTSGAFKVKLKCKRKRHDSKEHFIDDEIISYLFLIFIRSGLGYRSYFLVHISELTLQSAQITQSYPYEITLKDHVFLLRLRHLNGTFILIKIIHKGLTKYTSR